MSFSSSLCIRRWGHSGLWFLHLLNRWLVSEHIGPCGYNSFRFSHQVNVCDSIAHIELEVLCKRATRSSIALSLPQHGIDRDLRSKSCHFERLHFESFLSNFIMDQDIEIFGQNGYRVTIWRSSDRHHTITHSILKDRTAQGSSSLQVVPDMHPMR